MCFGRGQVFSECQCPAVTSLPGQAAAYTSSTQLMTIQGCAQANAAPNVSVPQLITAHSELCAQCSATHSSVISWVFTTPGHNVLFQLVPIAPGAQHPPCLAGHGDHLWLIQMGAVGGKKIHARFSICSLGLNFVSRYGGRR